MTHTVYSSGSKFLFLNITRIYTGIKDNFLQQKELKSFGNIKQHKQKIATITLHL